jgi:hypothetical protein
LFWTFLHSLYARAREAEWELGTFKDGTMYKDPGRNHFDRRSSDQQKNRLVKRLADLGYAVEIKPKSDFGDRMGVGSGQFAESALDTLYVARNRGRIDIVAF